MTLKKYIAQLQELAKKYPDAKVIYSGDDEGNYFGEVHYGPSTGNFKDGEFDQDGKVNAVCIN